jgi:hypothetical protein
MTLSLASGNLSQHLNMDCCEFHFYGFFIMNISVCFLEKVKIDMLYSFLYFNLCKTFFLQSTQFLYGYVWSWHGDSCANADLCPWRRGTSTNVFSILIFATSAHLASLLCINCYSTCLTSLTSWITSVFASARCDTPVIIHRGIMPRYPTIDLFS